WLFSPHASGWMLIRPEDGDPAVVLSHLQTKPQLVRVHGDDYLIYSDSSGVHLDRIGAAELERVYSNFAEITANSGTWVRREAGFVSLCLQDENDRCFEIPIVDVQLLTAPLITVH